MIDTKTLQHFGLRCRLSVLAIVACLMIDSLEGATASVSVSCRGGV